MDLAPEHIIALSLYQDCALVDASGDAGFGTPDSLPLSIPSTHALASPSSIAGSVWYLYGTQTVVRGI